jgi:hypothetical protein
LTGVNVVMSNAEEVQIRRTKESTSGTELLNESSAGPARVAATIMPMFTTRRGVWAIGVEMAVRDSRGKGVAATATTGWWSWPHGVGDRPIRAEAETV